MREAFDRELEQLKTEVATMGMYCERAIDLVSESLLEANMAKAQDMPELSLEITHKEREIESICLRLLLKQQPVASDLRLVSASLKMVTDLERIGDQSEDVAEIIRVDKFFYTGQDIPLRRMAEAVRKMVSESLDAFAKRDIQLAQSVIKYDDIVDNYFEDVKRLIVEKIKAQDCDGEYLLTLLMVCKYFERIADHASNVARWAEFAVTGVREGE